MTATDIRPATDIHAAIGWTPLVRLTNLFCWAPGTVTGKLEMLNPGGSIKDRVASHIVRQGLDDGSLTPDGHLVESSSGNFGIALAMVSRSVGLRFTCVVDPTIARANLRILRHLGATVDMVTEPDAGGEGYLHRRIARVHELLRVLPNAVWVNQYANPRCWQAHYHGIASELLRQCDSPPAAVVAAVSTTGTIMGLVRRLARHWPGTKFIAVDAVGSVIFGGRARRRRLPGVGASRVPEMLDSALVDHVVHVDEFEAARGCRRLARAEGILAGGSSGAAVHAVEQLLSSGEVSGDIVAVLPDRGERYLDLVYDDDWLGAGNGRSLVTAGR